MSAFDSAFVMQAGWSCSESCHLGYFMYMSFNETDFINFGKLFNYKNSGSAGYYKHNLTQYANPESKTWLASMVHLYHRRGTAKENYSLITLHAFCRVV